MKQTKEEKQRVKKVGKILKRLEGLIPAKSGCEILNDMRKQTKEPKINIEGIPIKSLGLSGYNFYSGLSNDNRNILIKFITEAKKQAKQEMLKDEIDWIENLDKGMWNEDDFEERLKELKSSLKENEKE